MFSFGGKIYSQSQVRNYKPIRSKQRPPNSSHDLFLNFEQFLKQVDDENMEFILTGELKCNFLETTASQVK